MTLNSSVMCGHTRAGHVTIVLVLYYVKPDIKAKNNFLSFDSYTCICVSMLLLHWCYNSWLLQIRHVFCHVVLKRRFHVVMHKKS